MFFLRLLVYVALIASVITPVSGGEQAPGQPSELDAATRRELKDVARLAYATVYDGWSSDEVLLQDELNAKYLTECRKRMPDIRAFDFNWTLLNLRKAGELRDIRATKRRRDRHDEYLHAAEIAARFLEDRYKVNTDRVICETLSRSCCVRRASPYVSHDACNRNLCRESWTGRSRSSPFPRRRSPTNRN